MRTTTAGAGAEHAKKDARKDPFGRARGADGGDQPRDARVPLQRRVAGVCRVSEPLRTVSDEGVRDVEGTIRFAVDKPMPAALVKKIVKTRVAENERRKWR